jgi:protein-L-isoaspartate(D-aspartate) O-methyltransferase
MFEFALETMISQQLVGRGVHDERVLGAFRAVPRVNFVPDYLETKAYADLDLPIGLGQTMSTPYAIARMLAELKLAPDHRVLEIGTGSGFMTALLSRLVKDVCTVEVLPELAARARKLLLQQMQLPNVQFLVGNGHAGWSEKAPFDAIIISAAGAEIPETLLGQLRDGGRLVMPIGDETAQCLRVVLRDDAGDEQVTDLTGADWDVLLAPLEDPYDDD